MSKITAGTYLIKFRGDWLNKPPEQQKRILDELYQDWIDNWGGTKRKEWDETFNSKDFKRYFEALGEK